MDLKIELRNTISEICIEKNNKKIVPMHATFLEIAKRVSLPHEDIKRSLNELISNGELEWGHTGNDYYFRRVVKKLG